MKPLNLATRPFRNERVPALLVAFLAFAVLVATVAQAFTFYRLQTAPLGGEQGRVVALKQQLDTLHHEAEVGKAVVPADTLARWSQVKDMVDSRTLSWTDLFSRLEATLPLNVRLVSIAPSVSKGVITLHITAVARTARDGRELVRLLEERGDFANVAPLSESPKDDGSAEFQYTMEYRPSVHPLAAAPAATPSPGKPGKPDKAQKPGKPGKADQDDDSADDDEAGN